LLHPQKLVVRFWNGDTASGANSLDGIFGTDSRADQNSRRDQARSANALTAVHRNIPSFVQCACNAGHERARRGHGGWNPAIRDRKRDKTDAVCLRSSRLAKQVKLSRLIALQQSNQNVNSSSPQAP
jgi:hypothetical protein